MERLVRGALGEDVLVVEVAAEEQVDVLREEIARGLRVGEIVERVMDEGQAEAGQRVSPGVRGEAVHLILGEEELAAVGVVAAQPRGVEADHVDIEGEVAHTARHAVTSAMSPVKQTRSPGMPSLTSSLRLSRQACPRTRLRRNGSLSRVPRSCKSEM
ncbi:hypothetical protein [Chondromyces apiculatus]|uniref:hypothetical protein n=1 Tax=Chondromyces apiculatus TaxID=51 RepID=UPI0018CC0AED|nr:hypothetical protein [Chondromyces apiculatus]